MYLCKLAETTGNTVPHSSSPSRSSCTHRQLQQRLRSILIASVFALMSCGQMMPMGRTPVLSGHAVVIANAETTLIAFSRTVILPQGVESCLPDPDANSLCTGGLTAALALFRNKTATVQPDTELFIPFIDKDSAFVQAHPLKAGVNINLYKAFNLSTYMAEPWLFFDLERTGSAVFEDRSSRLVAANIKLPSTNAMTPYVQPQIFIGNNSDTAVFTLVEHATTFSENALEIAKATVRYARKWSKVVIMMCDDKLTPSIDYFNQMYPNNPDVVIGMRAESSSSFCSIVNGSNYFCDISGVNPSLAAIEIKTMETTLPNGTTTKSVTGVSFTNVPLELTPQHKDALFYQQNAVLKKEVQASIANDPVVGGSEVTMAHGGWSNGLYPCFEGECAQATLYGKAYLEAYPSDFTFLLSGGFRGPGWSPGPIKLSQIFAAYPYTNTFCTGRLLGLKIWELYDLSLSKARFTDNFTETGDRLFQSVNVQVEVNVNLPDGSHRLIALRILNNDTGIYEPLQRLKYYTFVTDSFVCFTSGDVASVITSTLYDGEFVTLHSDKIVQSEVANYLNTHNPYNDLLSGFLGKVSSTVPFIWSNVQTSCGSSSFWATGVRSCLACPSGMEGVGTECRTIPSDPLKWVWTVAIPITIALLVLIISIAIFIEYRRRRDVRSIRNAPRSGNVAIIFTDIKESTKLWGTVPASMTVALDTHHRIIRDELRKVGGYEVKTVGDSFIMALQSAEEAVNMCVAVQQALAAASWPSAISEAYVADTDSVLMDIDDDPHNLVFSKEGVVWSGLRVRMGVHFGPVEAVFDKVSKGYDYYGQTVNIASRVESIACGGQVLITRNVETALISPHPTSHHSFTVSLFDTIQLRGVTGKTELLQVTPVGLEREFAPPSSFAPEVLPISSSPSPVKNKVNVLSAAGDGGGVDGGITVNSVSGGQSDRDSVETLNDGQRSVFESLQACFKLMGKDKKKSVVEAIAKAWRVKPDPSNTQATILAISRRAGQVIQHKHLFKEGASIMGRTTSDCLSMGIGPFILPPATQPSRSLHVVSIQSSFGEVDAIAPTGLGLQHNLQPQRQQINSGGGDAFSSTDGHDNPISNPLV